MVEEAKYIEVEVITRQNLQYRKSFSEWQKPQETNYKIKLEDTPDNRKFVSMLSRVCSTEEYIKNIGFTV